MIGSTVTGVLMALEPDTKSLPKVSGRKILSTPLTSTPLIVVVGLEVNVADKIDVIKNNLHAQFGFKPSYSDVVGYLLKLSENK